MQLPLPLPLPLPCIHPAGRQAVHLINSCFLLIDATSSFVTPLSFCKYRYVLVWVVSVVLDYHFSRVIPDRLLPSSRHRPGLARRPSLPRCSVWGRPGRVHSLRRRRRPCDSSVRVVVVVAETWIWRFLHHHHHRRCWTCRVN